jgi:glycosyltransferase involved in cell wall biosynthesis
MILYLGNNIKSNTTSVTTITTLSELLKKEGFIVKIKSSHNIQFFRLLSMLWTIIRCRSKISHVLIDTYSTRNFYYALFSSQLCRLFKLKYLPILHGGNLPNRLDNSSKLCRLIFSNSYKNVSPSNYLKTEFEKRDYKTTFIPNVLEIKDYTFLERKIEYPKLLYVRAFAKIYNPKMAVNVINKLLKTYPNALLCMIGPEKDESLQLCKSLVKSLMLENYVEFTGMLSKSQWHKKAKDYNIFINTTNIDNTPVSVMEAMALGLPVVSTNVGGIPFLIDDGVDGLLVEKNSVDAMVNAIIEIINNEEETRVLVSNARRKVEQLDWEIVKQLWHNILGE